MEFLRQILGTAVEQPLPRPEASLLPSKRAIFRVTGIPLDVTVGELNRALTSEFEQEGCSIDTSQTKICPSCHNPQAQTALIQFTATPGTPRALDNLPNNGVYAIHFDECGPDISIDKDFDGLTQLYPTTDAIQADIVAVCGLNGHAYGSWAAKGDHLNRRRMWLRDFLPTDLPQCRTMIYGYNSKLTSNSVHTVFDYTQDMLEELEKARQSEEEKERPIVFIGHSFGGIIIAQAIVKAKENKALYGPLFFSTRAAIFFGTPHRGMIVDDISAMIGQGSTRENILDMIKSDSSELRSELRRFINYSMDMGLKIVSFKEAEQTRKLQQCPDGRWSRSGPFITAVGSESAILQLPSAIEQSHSVEGDHSTMVKFHSREHKAYTSVVKHLRNIIALDSEKDLYAAYTAVQNKDASTLKRIFRRNTTIASQRQASKQETMLGIAVSNGDVATVSILLAHNADVGVYGQWDNTGLHMAAVHGHEKIAEQLLDHKLDINLPNRGGRTPLHCAAEYGQTGLVKMLLKREACIDDLDIYGNTPLALAAYNGHLGPLTVLLQNGADTTGSDNRNGCTAMDYALRHQNKKMIELLRNAKSPKRSG